MGSEQAHNSTVAETPQPVEQAVTARVQRPWYDWSTPIGIAIWICSFGVFLLLLHFAGIIP